MKNYIVQDCNYLKKAGAAFELHGDGGTDAKVLTTGMNSNITIIGLSIEGVNANNLLLEAMYGLSVSSIKLLDAYKDDTALWKDNPGALVTVNGVSSKTGSQLGCVGSGRIGRKGVSIVKTTGKVTGLSRERPKVWRL